MAEFGAEFEEYSYRGDGEELEACHGQDEEGEGWEVDWEIRDGVRVGGVRAPCEGMFFGWVVDG